MTLIKRLYGVFELAVIAGCLWVALYQTPLGALLRVAAATLAGRGSDQRSLFSYYGLAEHSGSRLTGLSPTAKPGRGGRVVPTATPPKQAAALGLALAVMQSDASTKQHAVQSLAERGVARGVWGKLDTAANALEVVLPEQVTPNVLLDWLLGRDAAAFSLRRASGEGRGSTYADLARQLPPDLADQVTVVAKASAFALGYQLGWPAEGPITSPFGMRVHPVSGAKKFHKGIDLGIPSGTAIHAALAGVVERSSYDAYNGHIVILDHGAQVRTLYLHNSQRLVAEGDSVSTSHTISKSGETGIATGPHLHYQLEILGEPVDPMLFRRGLNPAR